MNKSILPILLSAAVLVACDPGSDDGGAPATATATSGATEPGGSESPADTSDDGGDDDDSAEGTSGSDTSGSDDGADETGTGTGEPVTDPPSCEGLETQCAGESCCTVIELPGGALSMGRGDLGNDACPDDAGQTTCQEHEQPEHDITVDAFALDKYPVTVGRFRQFAAAWDDNWRPGPGDGENPAIPGSGWDASWSDLLPGGLTGSVSCSGTGQWTDEPDGKEDFPIGCVNWYQAQAFCIWDGGRLPTEAEFEFAAAGGDEDRLYPWGGATPDETRAVFYFANFETSPVGTTPDGAGRWGHHDLAGNISEWAFDCYEDDFYEDEAASGANPVNLPVSGVAPCPDPGSTEDAHVLRSGGGRFYSNLRSAARDYEGGNENFNSIGLRCARNL